MKKTFTFLSICFIVIAGGSKTFAQQNVIKINPLSLFVVTGNVQYERALNDKMSLQLGAFYGSVGLNFGIDNEEADYRYSWFGITPEFRFYVTNATKPAPSGFYLAPFIRYRQANVKFQAYDDFDYVDAKASVSAISPGATFGYQFLFSDVVALDLFFGGMYNIGNSSAEIISTGERAEYDGLTFDGVGIRTGLALGFAF